MKKKSLITITLEYLHKKHPERIGFTGKEIHEATGPASDEIFDSTPKELIDKKEEILKGEGYTLEMWQSVINQAGSLFFSPTKKEERINNQLRELLYNYQYQGQIYNPNYTWQLICQGLKRKNPTIAFTLIKGKKVYHLPK